MFAQDDGFLTTILKLLRTLPAYPIFGNGRTRLQPVYADDVAAAITQVLRQSKKPNSVYELAGPRVYSYEELVRTIAHTAGLRPVLMRTPFAFWDAFAGLAEILPRPPLTRNQVELMQIDTTACRDLARSEFQDYLKFYSTTDLASNAQFYLGEIAYSQRQYDAAVVEYDKMLTNYPKSFKLAPARLKKGMSLLELGQKNTGIRELREVVKRYPGTEEERRARAKLKELGVTTSAVAAQ